MRILRFLPVFFLALISCQDVKRVEKPDDLIAKEKMADVLLELALLQGAKNANRTFLEQTGIHPNTYIWEQFDIDSLQFIRSNEYYAAHYDEYLDIYEDVQARLELLKVEYDSLQEEQRRKTDLLRADGAEDSLERVKEERFRDSILKMSENPRKMIPPATLRKDSSS